MVMEASPLPKALEWHEITEILGDALPESQPGIQKLYRALFQSRQRSPTDAVPVLLQALDAPPCSLRSSSVLFRHECCYLLGQLGAATSDLGLKQACFGRLMTVLEDTAEDEVTRHEAAEGLAAVFGFVGDSEVVSNEDAETARARDTRLREALTRYASCGDGSPLGETCHIALEGLRRKLSKVCACQYQSYDPAIGDPSAKAEDVPRFAAVLSDQGAALYERYIAMFTLRNLGAVAEIAAALRSDVSSPVLRHELAFILGQMDDEAATEALCANLENTADHGMVRHESAIALGSIGGERAKACLQRFSSDGEAMVAESCLVALDTLAYWEAWEEAEKRVREQS
eukprot:TRINITY_DN18486_c0_g1_i2.p1 TRINITY_DN18486_c0_g1~~TRINITY_DN18486_c0_g1_i2.p1  ORF type:complete len:344 (-),score=68.66 TRINITY_DN18486_c0_g1_i2:181-1212(-)